MDNFKMGDIFILEDTRVVTKGFRTIQTIGKEHMEEVLYLPSEQRYISINFTKDMFDSFTDTDLNGHVKSIVTESILKDMKIIREVESIIEKRKNKPVTLSKDMLDLIKQDISISKRQFESDYFELFVRIKHNTHTLTMRNFDSMKRFKPVFQKVMNNFSKDYKDIPKGEGLIKYLKGELVHIIKIAHRGYYMSNVINRMQKDMSNIINAVCSKLYLTDVLVCGDATDVAITSAKHDVDRYMHEVNASQRIMITFLVELMNYHPVKQQYPLSKAYTGMMDELDDLYHAGLEPGKFNVFAGGGMSLGTILQLENALCIDIETDMLCDLPTGFGKCRSYPINLIEGLSAKPVDLNTKTDPIIELFDKVAEPPVRHQQAFRFPKSKGPIVRDSVRSKEYFDKFKGGNKNGTSFKNKK